MTTRKPNLLVPGALVQMMNVRLARMAGPLERMMILAASTEARRLLGGAELDILSGIETFSTFQLNHTLNTSKLIFSSSYFSSS